MNIVVNEALKAYIDPLTPEEHESLERSLLAEGCRDALVLWGEVLVDGHNRYGICQKHGLPFQTVQNLRFQSMADVHLWMIDQHLGRRSVSDFQRGLLALRKREILAERRARQVVATAATPSAERPGASPEAWAAEAPWGEQLPGAQGPDVLKSRADIAKAARLSNSQVVMIEKIQRQAAPELVAAVKAGTISINAAAAVATLPADEQKTAALGGKDELKQAAKRAREVNRKPLPEADMPPEGEDLGTIQSLQQRVTELSAENDALRRQVAALQARLASGALVG